MKILVDTEYAVVNGAHMRATCRDHPTDYLASLTLLVEECKVLSL
jgi:hypothetical protein